ADHPHEQPVPGLARHLTGRGQVLQTEEHTLAGTATHVGGGNSDLCGFGHHVLLGDVVVTVPPLPRPLSRGGERGDVAGGWCMGARPLHEPTPSPLAGEGWGEGGGNRRTTHRLTYHRQHLFSIEQYLVIPEPQYPKALTSEPLVALHIPGTGVVLAAIGLHNQPRTEVHEIHHIAAQR